ncbi:hypothetical protein Xcel_3173 [Xylanimonas cellulosilytica DSM 15894]|uniref:Uncharacterized protein n=1 Tax=Xylanimonas cellulosilytica (strain DSM 15894 / JCM 12276 / CECT 5975 / KCTC 9989 / LMG 20990 / NBRC 107835 / XIL07) TaxID=446471 RepID=D1C0H0_XYLCX|nr:hypothetical protein Xcel_3173 [Xylanimonas cellulosilytica DSM 15894]
MRSFRRKLTVLGVAAAVGVGGVATAVPAHAGSWTGSQSCPGSIYVKATGTKGGTGSITVYATGREYTDYTSGYGFNITVRGASSSGGWSVTGAGATYGYGFCGS